MHFGIGMGLQQPAGEDLRKHLSEGLDRLKRAEQMGFDYTGAGQHYLAYPYQMLQPFPVLALIAAETKMRLHATIVVPLQQPVGLAEDIATLDVISGGRMTLCAALGYRDEEYAGFGVERRTRVGRLEETLSILIQLWTKDEVTFHGKYFNLEHARPGIKPVQRPHPPILIATNSDAGVRRAGASGYPWYVAPAQPLSAITRQMLLYDEAGKAAGRAKPKEFAMSRGFCVRERREDAWKLAEKYLGAKFATYTRWGHDRTIPGETAFTSQGFKELAEGRFIIGTPDDCLREMERYAELGVSHMHLWMEWPGMPSEEAEKTMQLFGKKVRPVLKG